MCVYTSFINALIMSYPACITINIIINVVPCHLSMPVSRLHFSAQTLTGPVAGIRVSGGRPDNGCKRGDTDRLGGNISHRSMRNR